MFQPTYQTQLGVVRSFVREYGHVNELLGPSLYTDGKLILVPVGLTGDVSTGPLGFLDDVAQSSPHTPLGDYLIDQYGRRWMIAAGQFAGNYAEAPVAIPWPTTLPDLVIQVGVTPTPTTHLARFVGGDTKIIGPTYRMRGFDDTLEKLVFWTSAVIDNAGDAYGGPGPLSDIVIQQVLGSPAPR